MGLGGLELTAAPYTLYSLSTGALQGHPVTSTIPTADQVLTWNGAQWARFLHRVSHQV